MALPDHEIDDAELIRGAREWEQRQARAAQEAAAQPTRFADIPETDRSDERRYVTGIDCVDARLGFIRPGAFAVIFGLSGRGKTTLGEQMAAANARDYRVGYAALEMEPNDHRDSIMAREMGLTLAQYAAYEQSGEPTFLERCDRVRERFENLSIWEPADRTPRGILADADKAGFDLLFIDYSRYVKGWKPGNDANEVVAQFSKTSKAARRTTIMLSQLKPQPGKQGRPTEYDVGDAGRLLQEAEVAIFLHRPFYQSNDDVAEVIVAKNRFGKPGIVHTHYDGPRRTLLTMTDSEMADAACCREKKAEPRALKPAPEPAPPPRPVGFESREEEDAIIAQGDFPF